MRQRERLQTRCNNFKWNSIKIAKLQWSHGQLKLDQQQPYRHTISIPYKSTDSVEHLSFRWWWGNCRSRIYSLVLLPFHFCSVASSGVVCASFNHPGTIIPALNYRHQIYGLINVNNLVLSRFTVQKFQAINFGALGFSNSLPDECRVFRRWDSSSVHSISRGVEWRVWLQNNQRRN